MNVFRNWQAIENYMNTKIALPDVHYRVIDENGNDSDVVSVTPDANNSSVASVTANKAGTAIVLVTYDAMTHTEGMGGTELSAIWPEFTGVFVVTVDQDGTGIETNMVWAPPARRWMRSMISSTIWAARARPTASSPRAARPSPWRAPR